MERSDPHTEAPECVSLLEGQRSSLIDLWGEGLETKPQRDLGPGTVMHTGQKLLSVPTTLGSHWNRASLEITSFNVERHLCCYEPFIQATRSEHTFPRHRGERV